MIKSNVNLLTLEKILEHQAGIMVSNRFNLSQGDKILIRGIGTRSQFGVRGIKIILDGIPLTYPDGQSQLNNLDIQNIEQIEILKGPSSVMYGNSLGGIIIIKSESSNSNSISVNPNITIGSYGLRRYGINASVQLSNNNFLLSAYQTESSGFRKFSDAKFYGLNFISNLIFSNDLHLSFNVNYYNAPYLLNPSSLNKSESHNDPTSVRPTIVNSASAKNINQLQSGINLNYNFNSNSVIRTTLYGVKRDLLNTLPGRIIKLKRYVGGIRTEFENNFQLLNSPFKTLVGIDSEFQFDQRKEYSNGGIPNSLNLNPSELLDNIIYLENLINQKEDVINYGIFAQANYHPLDYFSITGGIRYDDYSFNVDQIYNKKKAEIRMDNISTMIGLNSRLTKNIILFANYSSGFQTPTTNELSNNPNGEGGFNELLRPETVDNYELGVHFELNKIKLNSSISFYWMNLSNMLIPYQTSTEENFYRNAGKAVNRGIEAKLRCNLFEGVYFTLMHNYIDFRFTDYVIESSDQGNIEKLQLEDNYLPGIPKHNLSLALEMNIIRNLDAKFYLSWNDKYFTNDENGPSKYSNSSKEDFVNDSYYNVDVYINYLLDFFKPQLNFKFGIENLINDRFNDSIVPNAFGNNFFEPASDRSYLFSLSLGI